MDLYLDDDSADQLLARLLRNAGHGVVLPTDVGRVGSPDPVHLREAIRHGCALISRNHDDFLWLHELVAESRGHHPGVVILRRENNPKRDLTAHGIARAIANLAAAGVELTDQFMILNQWR